MRAIGWHKSFQGDAPLEDVSSKVRDLETWYWLGQIGCVLLVVWGLRMVMLAPETDVKQIGIGLLLAFLGAVGVGLNKVSTRISLLICWQTRTLQAGNGQIPD